MRNGTAVIHITIDRSELERRAGVPVEVGDGWLHIVRMVLDDLDEKSKKLGRYEIRSISRLSEEDDTHVDYPVDVLIMEDRRESVADTIRRIKVLEPILDRAMEMAESTCESCGREIPEMEYYGDDYFECVCGEVSLR